MNFFLLVQYVNLDLVFHMRNLLFSVDAIRENETEFDQKTRAIFNLSECFYPFLSQIFCMIYLSFFLLLKSTIPVNSKTDLTLAFLYQPTALHLKLPSPFFTHSYHAFYRMICFVYTYVLFTLGVDVTIHFCQLPLYCFCTVLFKKKLLTLLQPGKQLIVVFEYCSQWSIQIRCFFVFRFLYIYIICV